MPLSSTLPQATPTQGTLQEAAIMQMLRRMQEQLAPLQQLSDRMATVESSIQWLQDHAVLDENPEDMYVPPGAPAPGE